MNAMQPPQSIEEIKAGLETTEKGGVRQSIRNCLTVFQRDPLLSGAIAYNILTDRKDIIKPIGFHRESTALNDTDMKYLLLYLEETYGLTNEKKIDNAIGIVANENKYHPIRDYLSALVWDGTERIRFCLRHFLGADADDYTYEALKLFLLGHVDRHGAGREEVIGHFKGLEGRNLPHEGFETLFDELGVFGGGTAFSFGFQRPPDDVTNHDATPFEQRLNQRRTWDAHAA